MVQIYSWFMSRIIFQFTCDDYCVIRFNMDRHFIVTTTLEYNNKYHIPTFNQLMWEFFNEFSNFSNMDGVAREVTYMLPTSCTIIVILNNVIVLSRTTLQTCGRHRNLTLSMPIWIVLHITLRISWLDFHVCWHHIYFYGTQHNVLTIIQLK